MTIGPKDKENTCLQEENEEKEKENTLLQEENDKLKAATKTATKTTLLDKHLETMSCPLSMDLFKDPVVSKFGHSFERVYIVKWLETADYCPFINAKMTSTDLVSNYALADVVEAYKTQELSWLHTTYSCKPRPLAHVVLPGETMGST